MRILVTEDRLGGSNEAVADLVAAGHDVVRCQPANGHVSPCVGLAGGECPLSHPVDVAVAVHSGVSGVAIVAREFGIVCAGHDHVPLVSVAAQRDNPLPGHPVTTAHSLVAAVERVAAGELRPSGRELAGVVRNTLAGTGDTLSSSAPVVVSYADGPVSYDVVVHLPIQISTDGLAAATHELRAAISADGDRHVLPLRDIAFLTPPPV